MAHLYASFGDAVLAEKAAGALLDYGVRKEDVSLIANDAYAQTRSTSYSYAETPASERLAGVVTGAAAAMGATAGGGVDTGDYETAAKEGISTTTPEDAGAGAIKGTEIGLGIGIIAGLAAMLVPGVGLVLGGGALASAIGGAALTAGAGAIVGGVTGYLKEQGVPGEAAQQYQGVVTNGGAILNVSLPSGDVDQATAEGVLAKYHAMDLHSY